MKQAARVMQILAHKLLAQEVDANEPHEPGIHTALRAIEKLRLYLGKLVGVSGYQALLARAVALARAEAPWLGAVQVKADGALDGFETTAAQQDPEAAMQGALALLAQLLGLLITFIGETLTLRLIADIWPDAPLKDTSDRNDLSTDGEEIPS